MDQLLESAALEKPSRRPRIFITMPAYRAEGTVGKTVADIPKGLAEELILVDDASPDRTVERARDLGVRVFVHPRNRGYGGNQKSCYSIALEQGADLVVLLHPDYQYDPKAVPLLIAPILAGDADMTFGSRFAGLSDPRSGGMPMYRYIGNRLTTHLENAMLRSRFTEMHSGMRAYTRQSLLGLPFRSYSDDYVFDSQLLVDAVTSGQRVVEVPIPTRYTSESSSISVLRSMRYVAGSALYCAARTTQRGPRGQRWPGGISSLRRGTLLGHGTPLSLRCPLCDAGVRVVVRTNLVQCLNCGLVSAKDHDPAAKSEGTNDPQRFESTLSRLRRFWLPGPKLAIIGRDAEDLTRIARDAGWRPEVAPSGANLPTRSFDAIVIQDRLSDVDSPIDTLRGIARSLTLDGLLAVVSSDMVDERITFRARRHNFGRATLHAAMSRSGLRVVDWSEWSSPRHGRVPSRWALGVARNGRIRLP